MFVMFVCLSRRYVDEKTAAEDISEDLIQSLAVTTNLINEREQEIANIAKSVQEIAEMFKDLSALIIEQVLSTRCELAALLRMMTAAALCHRAGTIHAL